MATENLSRIASDFETQLSAAISVGGTSFTIQSVTDLDGNDLSDGLYCFTIDRDNTDAKEYLIGQLTSATKTVASISSVGRQGALTANAQRAHRIGGNVIISDHSILAAIARIFSGQGTINPSAPLAYTTDPTLSSSTELATKGYVDSVVTGGTVNSDRIILGSQTAGETVAAGNIVYFKSSDSRWWLADADLTATFSNVLIGVALGAGTAGNAISGGVQVYGKCDSFTGLTATATYYLSNTAGGVSSSAGTYSVILGQAFSTTGIFINPNATLALAIATSAGAGDAGKPIKTNASGVIDQTLTTIPVVRTYVNSGSPHTWTKPAGLKYIIVEGVAGGGSGGSGQKTGDDGAGGGGGGAGGYFKKLIAVASLGATETVTVGAAQASSSFGSHCSATAGGNGSTQTPGVGGVGTGGDINTYGSDGCVGEDTGSNGNTGGSSHFGGGGRGARGNSDPGDDGHVYGSGGGGGGGLASSSGGGASGGGAGAAGFITLTEYFN